MSEQNLWYGFLDAGAKSSHIVMDNRLSTGNPDTVYIFNLKRGEIVEYKREIVEAKLRPLNGDDGDVTGELRSAYRKARNGFVPRAVRTAQILEKAAAAATSKSKSYEEPDIPVDDEGMDDFDVDSEGDED